MIPALTALRGWSTIPGDIQRLQVALANIDQILLQGIVPEGVLDRVNAGLAILAHGCYLVSAIVFEQARVDTVKADHDVVEITQHVGFSGWQHRLVVI